MLEQGTSALAGSNLFFGVYGAKMSHSRMRKRCKVAQEGRGAPVRHAPVFEAQPKRAGLRGRMSRKPAHDAPVAASARSPAEKQLSGTVLLLCALPRGTVGRSRSSREAARATPQLAAAPVPPVAGERDPFGRTMQRQAGAFPPSSPFLYVISCIT